MTNIPNSVIVGLCGSFNAPSGSEEVSAVIANRNNIKAEMVRNGFSIKEMAEKLNLSYGGFFRKLAGERKFVENELYKLSKILNVNIDIFFS